MKQKSPPRAGSFPPPLSWTGLGSCLKTGQHFIFVIIYLLLPIKCLIIYSVSKILFNFFLLPIIIMILIMKILLHNVHKIIILRYPTYVCQFLIFLIITKIECWPVFKQDPWPVHLVGQYCTLGANWAGPGIGHPTIDVHQYWESEAWCPSL